MEDYQELANKLGKSLQDLLALEQKLLQRTEVIAMRYSMQAFKKMQWDGQSWEKRKSNSQTRYDRRNKDRPRNLLIKSGDLRRSVSVISSGSKVIISSDMPYSEIHNEGGTINHPGGTPYTFDKKTGLMKFISRKKADELEVRAERKSKNSQITNTRRFKVTKPHKIEIPKRQFIGNSSEMDKQIEDMIYKELDKTFML
jgi:phage gpG-like protein